MKNILLTFLLIFLIGSFGQAQDNTSAVKVRKQSLSIHVNEELKPDVYIDDIKIDPIVLDLLDPDKIATMTVVKGETAIEKYNAPNGVVLITSKKQNVELSTIKIRKVSGEDAHPVVIIDGKISTQEALSKLSPDEIQSINVIKGETAINEYDAPQGVIDIKTKK